MSVHSLWKYAGIILFAGTAILHGQQISADVSVIIERLSLDKQQRLKNLDQEIATYLSDYDWTGEDLEPAIPVTVQIFLQDVSASHEDRYMGTFLISNGTDIQYYDKYWRFPYKHGDPLVHLPNVYHPFTGFLDFYVYLILGGEYDKMGRLAGSPYFEKAKQISDQAMFDANFQRGWKERAELIHYLLSEDYKPFRDMKDLFYLGLSYIEEDMDMAQKYCEEAVAALEKIFRKDPEHKDAINFVKSHYIEIIDIFKDRPDVLRRMIRIDPDHKGAYEQHMH
ncbi:MAG TPA: DUF4835 family protein [bacterium]|nr:DUF4835 family protein [bacterium]